MTSFSSSPSFIYFFTSFSSLLHLIEYTFTFSFFLLCLFFILFSSFVSLSFRSLFLRFVFFIFSSHSVLMSFLFTFVSFNFNLCKYVSPLSLVRDIVYHYHIPSSLFSTPFALTTDISLLLLDNVDME